MLERKPRRRRGIVAILVACSLIGILGATAIAVDGGLLQDNKRRTQAAADAAALAAASTIFQNYPTIAISGVFDPGGKAAAAAQAAATANGFPNNGTTSTVVVNIPPKSGPFAGKVSYAEVIITYNQPRYFSGIWSNATVLVRARAVAKGFWGGSGNGVIVLDPVAQYSLDASGQGSVTVTGGAYFIVDSNNVQAARVTGGAAALTAAKFEITGNTVGVFNGPVETGVLPTPDPLAYLPEPAKPADGVMTKSTKSGFKTYYLTPGRYTNLPNFGNGDTVILQQGGIYYIDGGGLTSTNGASIIMDPNTKGGVMIYNAPNGTQTSQSINISGGIVNLSPLTSGPYKGLLFFQERTSPVPLSLQGQGGFTIHGTFYAANALMSVAGQGTNIIGSQYISRTLSMSGGGNTIIDYTPDGTAAERDILLVE